jgi:hypothetical protein
MAAINHPLGGARRGIPFPAPRINGWILASVLVASLGAALPVLQHSIATSRGFDSQLLDARQAQLQGEIRALEAAVARLASLDRVEQRANELGMVPAEDPLYVTVDEPGPAPAKVPAELLPRAVPAEPDDPAPWWRMSVNWLPLPW